MGHVLAVASHGSSANVSFDECDVCVHQINISDSVPLQWAVPMYGYVMPLLVAITAVTNSFIVIVLYQKHLRTPTNYILLSMAVTDLLTGLTSVPWFVYYYTLKGYITDLAWGLVPFWCYAHPYLSQMVPTIWHTAAIWLTVYLAIQRYVYVCVPSSVHLYCTPRTTKICIVTIVLLAFISEIPELLGKHLEHGIENNRAVCNLRYAPWVLEVVGVQMFYSLYYWFRVTFVHGIPCFLLLFAIYCSMSEQFRLTVRQLFSTRLLFVAQAQATFHGGKRYSLILVDVELLDPKSLITRRSLRANDQRRTVAATIIEMNDHAEPCRKQRVGRQVSFPNEVIEREENM
ncbi:hypothetical protein QR680_002004 [Steinernema hermaphroditum]|uniref:G-protein coupled receptors family 1 profile domain-containing protein n=1 Tax=Steinernema hermaphroditum TaxID=289476 RepID=A0AA39LHD2_9BILA|nr:hypothetical protein QR680_002004 [Steinernema hermaphroditum]